MPAQKHNFTVTEIKAGLMVIVGVLVFIVFLAAVQGLRPPEQVNTFYAYFKDTQGLNKRADVRFGGALAGKVTAIDLDPSRPTELRVTAQVGPEFPINGDSLAMIGQTTLTAEKHLEITTGSKEAKRLPSEAELKTGGGSLFNQADEIARNVNKVVERVLDLLGVEEYAKNKEEAAAEGKEKVATIADIFADLRNTVEETTGFVKDIRGVLEDSRGNVGDILEKVKGVEDSANDLLGRVNGMLDENRPNIQSSVESLRTVLTDVGKITSGLAEQLDTVANTLQSILDNAASLSNEAQEMLKNNRPVVEDAILDVRDTVRNLKEFSRTIAEQPDSVIRGQEPQGRNPKEK